MRLKRCKNPTCRQQFAPTKPMQTVCGPLCAHGLVMANKAKKDRKETREKLDAIKNKSELKEEAQAAFNAFIRYRDISAGHNCICCGKPFEPNRPGGSVDGGHYLSRGSHPNLAFDERNVHAQRKNCNRPGGTTAAQFRLGMIARIGLSAVEELEADTTPRRYRADDYRRIKDEYRAKLRELKQFNRATGLQPGRASPIGAVPVPFQPVGGR